jgi:predicted HD superfamily hydrolase involved in NAD metabolism
MAVIFGYNEEKARITGILHDCAKCLSDEELLANCEKYHLTVTETEQQCPFLLHGKVGAAFARDRYGIEDEEILSAITFHTTGRPAMTLLEKIIFTADYIEPYRKPLPRITQLREAAYSDINLAVCLVLENMIQYLESSSDVIDTITIDTYHYYNKSSERGL